MKIKAKKETIASMKLIVPVDGLITIDAEGIADVSEKCADLLVNNTNDWKFLVEDSEGEKTASEGEVVNDEEEDTPKSDRELFEEKIRTANKNELIEMCTEAKFPETEWKKLSKALLVEYLLKKYDEVADEEE